MSETPIALADVVTSTGTIEASRLSRYLKVSRSELVAAAGLAARVNTSASQRRLREMVDIVWRLLPWAGSLPQAFAWYRAQPIPSFGDRTAEDLVKEGRAEVVKQYLARIAVGGFA